MYWIKTEKKHKEKGKNSLMGAASAGLSSAYNCMVQDVLGAYSSDPATCNTRGQYPVDLDGARLDIAVC